MSKKDMSTDTFIDVLKHIKDQANSIDESIADKSPISDQIMKAHKRSKDAKRNNYLYSFGNDQFAEVKSYSYLNAKSGRLTNGDLKNMDFMDLIRFLLYIVEGRSQNPNNPYAKYDPARSM